MKTAHNTNMEKGQQDHMPAEVATAMLLAPKAKLSNRMRKNCRAARCQYWTGPVPFLRNKSAVGPQYLDGRDKRNTLEDRFLNRAHRATLLQLVKWERRSLAKSRGHDRRADKAGTLAARSHHKARVYTLREWAGRCNCEIKIRHQSHA